MTDQIPITMTSLADCTLSPQNPRQIVDADAITDLAASIRAIGLIQNLAGWQTQDGSVDIVAGGWRLRALQRSGGIRADRGGITRRRSAMLPHFH